MDSAGGNGAVDSAGGSKPEESPDGITSAAPSVGTGILASAGARGGAASSG